MNRIRVSLLHLALKPGALTRNHGLLERGIRTASTLGSDLVVAPELSISGYEFNDAIGTPNATRQTGSTTWRPW